MSPELEFPWPHSFTTVPSAAKISSFLDFQADAIPASSCWRRGGNKRQLEAATPVLNQSYGASQGSIPAGIYPVWEIFGWRIWERQSSKMFSTFHPTEFQEAFFHWGWPQFGAYNLILGGKYLPGKGGEPQQSCLGNGWRDFSPPGMPEVMCGLWGAPFVSSLAFLWRVSSKLSSQKQGFIFWGFVFGLWH